MHINPDAKKSDSNKPAPKRSYRAPALEKGLDILDILVSTNKPLSMGEIAERLSRSRNEIFRMLAVLENYGYLTRPAGTDLFHLTNRLFEQGMQIRPISNLLEHALPLMRDLNYRNRQACYLAVGSGSQAVVIARMESPLDVGFTVQVGYRESLLQSSSGWVLLSWMGEQRRREAYRLLRQEEPLNFDARHCDETTEAIRRHGFARQPSRIVDNVEDLACPVLSLDRKTAVASLTVPYLRYHDGNGKTATDVDQALHNLRETAEEISHLVSVYGDF